MRHQVLTIGFVLTAAVVRLSAQTDSLDKLNPLSPNPRGLRLQSVSGFFGYYSGGLNGYGSSLANSGAAIQAGGSATLGYTWLAERSGLSVAYRPTFVRSFQSSGFSTSTHDVSINWRHSSTPRLSYTLSLSGNLTSLSEALVGTASVPDSQSAPAETAPTQNTSLALFYGSRYVNTTIQGSIAYASSARATWQAGFSASLTESLPYGSTAGQYQPAYLVPRTTSGAANLSYAYSLTPYTHVSFSASSTRSFSRLYDAYSTTGDISVAHSMGMRWSVQAHGGAGFTDPLRRSNFGYSAYSGLQYQTGGGVAYKATSHTFQLQIDRAISDQFGFGARSTLSAIGTWNWARPGRSWWWTSSFSEQLMSQTVLGNITSWQATAGVGRRVGPHVSSFLQYGYGTYSGVTSGPQRQFTQHTVRLSFVLTPAASARF